MNTCSSHPQWQGPVSRQEAGDLHLPEECGGLAEVEVVRGLPPPHHHQPRHVSVQHRHPALGIGVKSYQHIL